MRLMHLDGMVRGTTLRVWAGGRELPHKAER